MHRISGKRVLARLGLAAALFGAFGAPAAVHGTDAATAAPAQDTHGELVVKGGGATIVEGGTGAPDFIPVKTVFAFHAHGDQGAFECVAFVPSVAPGEPGSANFDTRVMYVTGTITSARATSMHTAVLAGTATVTGVGAGSDVPFEVTLHSGGPGTPFALKVSGLTFPETVIEGSISISRR